MYHLEGSDFTNLIKRQFTEKFISRESTVNTDQFELNTRTFRGDNFDILHFKSSVYTPLQINNMEDGNHVSLHFQLSGHSTANISGFNSTPGSGNFNLLNCINPVSTFIYPKKGIYEYLCVAFEPAYFDKIIAECIGESDSGFPGKSDLFPFFSTSRSTDYWQMNAIKLIQHPPVADTLKAAYIRSKIAELSVLTFSRYAHQPVATLKHLKSRDIDHLIAVKEYLDKNYLLRLSLEGLSRMFMLNEFKLKSGFKTRFGSTVFGYIQQLRMQHAVEMLKEEKYSIAEIALTIGYESDTSFIRAFKLYYNCSPGKMAWA